MLKNPAYHFRRIGLEAGPLSQWLFSALAEAGLPVICVETLKPDDPNLTNFQAYFGTDQTRYSAQSPINYVKAAKPMPTFIVISEYDNPDLDTQGALLFGALCERDRACPRFTRMELHNHLSMVYQFNTADDALGRQILEFIRRGR